MENQDEMVHIELLIIKSERVELDKELTWYYDIYKSMFNLLLSVNVSVGNSKLGMTVTNSSSAINFKWI